MSVFVNSYLATLPKRSYNKHAKVLLSRFDDGYCGETVAQRLEWANVEYFSGYNRWEFSGYTLPKPLYNKRNYPVIQGYVEFLKERLDGKHNQIIEAVNQHPEVMALPYHNKKVMLRTVMNGSESSVNICQSPEGYVNITLRGMGTIISMLFD